jgi:hypothetical protein
MNKISNKNFTAESIGSAEGLDIATVYIEGGEYYGYFDHSPVEERLKTNFHYRTVKDKIKKPYMAHWMVYEHELLLGYVNGMIDGKQFYTTDVIPELPEDKLLHFYSDFSGVIKFYLPLKKPRVLSQYFLKKHCVSKLLTFQDGKLTKVS